MLDLTVLSRIGSMRNRQWILDEYLKDQEIFGHFSKLINQGVGEVKLEQSGFGLRNALRNSSGWRLKLGVGELLNSSY